MNKSSNQPDQLGKLFTQLPKEKLPASFRSNVMQQIMAEAIRVRKRNERLGLAAISAASAVMLAMLVLIFIYMDIPVPDMSLPDMPSMTLPSLTAVSGSLYIGLLTLLLLLGDHQLRKVFKRRHKD